MTSVLKTKNKTKNRPDILVQRKEVVSSRKSVLCLKHLIKVLWSTYWIHKLYNNKYQ